jgi:sec-independent protein translocase protein TatB
LSILGMDIGWGELLIILIVALLVIGPEKLPAYARKAARVVRNIQKVTAGITGDISKAINLDDEEDGKARGMKKDLIEVKKSLEKDVADLKAELDAQAKTVSKTMEASTKEASEQLEENAKEISETLKTETGNLNTELDAQAKTISETLESGTKEVKTKLDQNTKEIADILNEQPGSEPKTVSDAGSKAGSGTVNPDIESVSFSPAQSAGGVSDAIAGGTAKTAATAIEKNVLEPSPAPPPVPRSRKKSPGL